MGLREEKEVLQTREALQEALAEAFYTVTAQDAQDWFRHADLLPYAAR